MSLLIALALTSAVHADPKVSNIAGADAVVVREASGKSRAVKEGEALAPGDTVQTTSRMAVKLGYADGSFVALGRSTKLEIQPEKDGARAARLENGIARVLVKPLPAGQPVPKRPRFVIRTVAATMGVRGTEFITLADMAKATTDVTTLNGTVEVTRGDGTMREATSGSTVHVDRASIHAPTPASQAEFIKSLQAREPELDKVSNATTDSRGKSGFEVMDVNNNSGAPAPGGGATTSGGAGGGSDNPSSGEVQVPVSESLSFGSKPKAAPSPAR